MHNNWTKSELLTERGIDIYENDLASKFEFDQHFKKYDKYIYPGIIFFLFAVCGIFALCIMDIIFDMNGPMAASLVMGLGIGSILGMFVSMIASEKVKNKKRDTPTICSRCQNIMSCYYYTDEVSTHDLNGVVY